MKLACRAIVPAVSFYLALLPAPQPAQAQGGYPPQGYYPERGGYAPGAYPQRGPYSASPAPNDYPPQGWGQWGGPPPAPQAGPQPGPQIGPGIGPQTGSPPSPGRPQVNVRQGRPDINVRQPAPEITVRQPPPQINIQQPPPQVTIRQAAPTVTVRQAPLNVTVKQGPSQVMVQQPQPQVSVEQGQPRASVQQQEPPVSPSQGAQRAEPAAAPGRAPHNASAFQAPAAGTEAQSRAQGGPVYRSTQLLGRPVGGGHETDLGTLRDLIIERSGQVSRAVIGSGGFLGMGSRLAVVPFETLHITPLGRMVYEQASRKPLDQQPELKDELLNRGQELRSTQLVGAKVRNARGEDLGRIDDLLIGRQDGRVHGIILSVGGLLGIGGKLVELPFDALDLGDDGQVIARADKKSLEQQPQFSYQN